MSDVNLKDFIKDLEAINNENTVSIKVPSCKKNYKFKLICVSQHKELLKSAFEGYEGVIRSGVIFNNILRTNSEEEYDFTLLDRSPILVELRKASIGTAIKVEGREYDLNDLPGTSGKVEEAATIDQQGIQVELRIPTLERDDKISNKVISEFNKLADSEKDTEAINLVLSYEIVKFIESITINESTFVFDDYNLTDCKKLVDALPLKLNNKIIEFLTDFRTYENQGLTFEDGTILEIDASFLSSE